MNSSIFTGDTLARFSVFWKVSLKYLNDDTWIGLTDLAVQDRFVWENGELLNDQLALWIFRPGYPNKSKKNENCAEARHGGWPGIYGLNDARCQTEKFYMCEPLDKYIAK